MSATICFFPHLDKRPVRVSVDRLTCDLVLDISDGEAKLQVFSDNLESLRNLGSRIVAAAEKLMVAESPEVVEVLDAVAIGVPTPPEWWPDDDSPLAKATAEKTFPTDQLLELQAAVEKTPPPY